MTTALLAGAIAEYSKWDHYHTHGCNGSLRRQVISCHDRNLARWYFDDPFCDILLYLSWHFVHNLPGHKSQRCLAGLWVYLCTEPLTGRHRFWPSQMLFYVAFYPRPVLAFGYCRCLRLSVCVFVRVRQPSACPRDNSSSVQARITKFGP